MSTYSDIDLTNLDDVEDSVRGSSFRHNIAGDRVIIKWDGEAPECVDLLGCVYRTHAEAIEYYSNTANGWCEDPLVL